MFFIWIVLFGLTNVLCEDFYSFTVKDSEGNDVQLEQYRGKVNSVCIERKTQNFIFRFHWLLM